MYGFQEYDIVFIFALRIQSANYMLFDFFDRYFLNVSGRSRDQKCAFLGESRATLTKDISSLQIASVRRRTPVDAP